MLLKGTMYITDKEEIAYNVPYNSNIRIISLDEDGVLPKAPNILIGTCLLPPIEAKIAEADGNEALYDHAYTTHLLQHNQQEFVSALLAYLYRGGNLIVFLPELGYNNTTLKFQQMMFKIFGIHPGLLGSPDPRIANWYTDETCIPIWLNDIYLISVISPYEYLAVYPMNAMINNNMVIDKLIRDINPFGKNINEQFDYILRLHRLLHINPKVRPAIYSRWEAIV